MDDTESGRRSQQNNVARARLWTRSLIVDGDTQIDGDILIFGSQSQGSVKQTYASTTAGEDAVSLIHLTAVGI
jgi:hypothetical protein